MDYKDALLDLIAYCQRQEVLSAGEEVVCELSDILGWDKDDINEYIFN